MKTQVLVLALSDADQLAGLRTQSALLVGVQGDQIWVRGVIEELASSLAIKGLPALARYSLGADDLLFPLGKATPEGYLPRLDWQPIVRYFAVSLPVAAYGGEVSGEIVIKLVPATAEAKVAALMCQLPDLKAWAEAAPQVRMECLQMAVSDDGAAFVVGEPLPTLPGDGYWRRGAIWLPAGWDLEFPMLATTIFQSLSPDTQSTVLIHLDNTFEAIPDASFVKVTRSGVRQTLPFS